jgi:hypothetical protein
MTNQSSQNENLADEFQALGKNLVDVMRAAWESPERKRLQQEIESGLQELETTIKREAETFSNSPTGERLKQDVSKLGEKINTSDTPELIRQELIKALQTANFELQNIINRWSTDQPQDSDSQSEEPGEGQQ